MNHNDLIRYTPFLRIPFAVGGEKCDTLRYRPLHRASIWRRVWAEIKRKGGAK